MKLLNGITRLLIFQLLGEIGVLALRMPMPDPVLGIWLLSVPKDPGHNNLSIRL